MHAAQVVSELRAICRDCAFIGTGGAGLRKAGVNLLAEVGDLQAMGFSEIPRLLPRLSRLGRELTGQVSDLGIELAILVDYPGFNLHLARMLKRLPQPPKVLYYIAPQVWAWGRGRVKTIAANVDHAAVVFPFEAELFASVGVRSTFVGHPLLDELPTEQADVRRDGKRILALLPGSRRMEIARHLPLMLKAAAVLRREFPDLRIAVGKAPNFESAEYAGHLTRVDWAELWEDSICLLSSSSAAVVCSGTASLEAALVGVPQVVVYRTSFLNYLILKRLIRVAHVSLVNIVCGREVVKELLQGNFTVPRVVKEVRRLLTDDNQREIVLEDYRRLREKLGAPGAARRVAYIAYQMLQTRLEGSQP